MYDAIPPGEHPGKVTLLMRLSQRGDPDALNGLCSHYAPLMRSWATGRIPHVLRRVLETGDLVQEVIIRVLRNLQRLRLRNSGDLDRYLRRSLKNRIRDLIRQAPRVPAFVELDQCPRAAGSDPIRKLEDARIREEYDHALSTLRDFERRAVIARLEADLSYAEIAEEVGLTSAEAARKVVTRSLVKLARRMGG